MNIPLDKAELLSMLLEGILYGFSLLMFGGTVWQLLSRRPTHRINYQMLAVACLLLFNGTAHLVIDIIRIMEGLILYRDTYPGGPVAFFSDWSQWTFVSKNYLYTVQSLTGDGVILYRCYVVWKSKLVMVLPVLLWCATLVTGIGSPYTASQTGHSNTNVFTGSLARWIKSYFATSFATNALATFLLASRIWYIDRKTAKLRDHSESQLRKILRIILDAGVIYLLSLLVGLISFVCKSNSQFVILDLLVPIISITFYMVILRVGLVGRGNQSVGARSVRYISAGNGFEAHTSHSSQAHVTILTEIRVDDEWRSSPSSVTTVG